MGPDLSRAERFSERRDAPPQLRQRQLPRLTESWGGDLVFFHVDPDPNSHVYHVAIYEGGNRIVSAIDEAAGTGQQTIWSPDVTFGTITHWATLAVLISAGGSVPGRRP